MEKTMNKHTGTVRLAITRGLDSGLERPPLKLLALLESHDDPIKALSDMDSGNDIFKALFEEFEFLTRLRTGCCDISEAELSDFVCLLRWLTQQLIFWSEANDPLRRKLTACFVAAQIIGQVESVWELFPARLAKNEALLNFLAALLSSYRANLAANTSARPSESEILEKFRNADSQEDWPAIGEFLPHLDHRFHANSFLTQSTCCLFQFGFGSLVSAISGIAQIYVALEVCRALPIAYRLQLGAASANAYVQFAALCEIDAAQLKKYPLTDSEHGALQIIFQSVANDKRRWSLWMQCFNRFPARYPTLQVGLGRFLASAPESVVDAYFENISLSRGMPDNRLAVACCLQTFRGLASQENRKYAWKVAVKCWSQWNFGASDTKRHLVSIVSSELDYAIVGYCIECLSPTQLNDAIENIHNSLFSLDTQWHPSITDFQSAAYRLLSQLQPYAHATKLVPSDNWLWTKQQRYYSFDIDSNQYAAMLFGL